MFSRMRKTLGVVAGRFWWILVVGDSRGEGPAAHILRVVRGVGGSAVDVSFSGTLEECRRFQMSAGGADDGILLMDDATPVKIVSDGLDSPVDFPGYKDEDFDNVKAVSGDFSAVALRSAVDNMAQEVQKAGFRILLHVPSVFALAELLESPDEESRIFTNAENGMSSLMLYSGGHLLAGYRVPGDSCGNLVKYVRERFLLKEAPEETFAMDYPALALALAEDAWLFRTDGVPAFHTQADRASLKRIREAALFRRVSKACAAILVLSFVVLSLFCIGENIYASRSESVVHNFKTRIQKQKDLAAVVDKLEKDRAQSEEFLKHRSSVSTSLGIFAKHVPENVWISRWDLAGRSHSVQGYAVTSEDLSGFLASLESERTLVNVRLRTTEKTTWKKYQVVRFNLSAEDAR